MDAVRLTQALARAESRLASAGVPSPRVDAELLAAHVLGVPRGQLPLTQELTPEQQARLATLVRERAARVPLQHLTGTAPFRRLELSVGPGVFVPRPETELLVEWGLARLRGDPARAEPVVVDLCAGSGAIAASVAVEACGARVYAVEWDASAMKWLRPNVADMQVTVVDADATDPATLSELDGRVDLVLANPPYVPLIGAAGLPAEVLEHDPHPAVFAGEDGLEVIRALIPRAAALLRPGGAFAVEHDDTHAYVVPALVSADGRFTNIELHHDLAGRPRFTTAIRAVGPDQVADFTT